MGSGGTGLGIGGGAEAGTTAGTGALAAITGGLVAAMLEVGAGFAGGVIIVLVGVMAAGGGVLFDATVLGGAEVLRFGGSSGVAGAAAFADGREALGAAFAGAVAVVLDATGVALASGFFTAPESVSVTSMETT